MLGTFRFVVQWFVVFWAVYEAILPDRIRVNDSSTRSELLESSTAIVRRGLYTL